MKNANSVLADEVTSHGRSRPEVFCKKGVLRNFIKKETLAQVFSCEFCEISKNTFFYRTPLVAASIVIIKKILLFI